MRANSARVAKQAKNSARAKCQTRRVLNFATFVSWRAKIRLQCCGVPSSTSLSLGVAVFPANLSSLVVLLYLLTSYTDVLHSLRSRALYSRQINRLTYLSLCFPLLRSSLLMVSCVPFSLFHVFRVMCSVPSLGISPRPKVCKQAEMETGKGMGANGSRYLHTVDLFMIMSLDREQEKSNGKLSGYPMLLGIETLCFLTVFT